MSGGSLNYLYTTVEEAAMTIRQRSRQDPWFLAFADHLNLVAKALHDVEWALSFDYSTAQAYPAIQACVPSHADIRFLLAHAEETLHTLRVHLDQAYRHAQQFDANLTPKESL
jgi:hypothetical protein